MNGNFFKALQVKKVSVAEEMMMGDCLDRRKKFIMVRLNTL